MKHAAAVAKAIETSKFESVSRHDSETVKTRAAEILVDMAEFLDDLIVKQDEMIEEVKRYADDLRKDHSWNQFKNNAPSLVAISAVIAARTSCLRGTLTSHDLLVAYDEAMNETATSGE